MRSNRQKSRLVASMMVVIVLVIYQLFYSFSFFPITEGWFSEYGILIRSGKVPYRDFPLLMTPLYPVLVAIVQNIFGEGFLPLRVLGVLVTSGIGLGMWMILAEFFNPWASAFGAVVAAIYYQSGVAYIGYDFTQVVSLFLIFGVYCMILDVGVNVRRRFGSVINPAFFAGLFLSAAVMTKQSNGGVASLVLSVVYVFVTVRVHDKGQRMSRLLHYSAGLLSITGTGLVLLTLNGATGEFMQQVVMDAIRAKGGTGKIFTAWISGILTSQSLIAQSRELFVDVTVIMAMTGIPYVLIRILRNRMKGTVSTSARDGVLSAVIGVIGMLLVIALILRLRYRGVFFGNDVRDQGALVYNNVILLSLLMYLAGTIIAMFKLIIKSSEGAGKAVLLFSFGLALIAANGTSAGLSEISSFVGLGIAISFLMTLSVPFVISSIVPIGISLLLLALLVEKKFEAPYSWWSVKTQDVRMPLKRVVNDELFGGTGMDVEKYQNLESMVSIIRKRTRPGDRLYVFPHMPVFNIMSHRMPYDNLVVSWFDFMNVRSGELLVENLGINPPTALVVATLSDDVFTAHERLFNNNAPCIQRKIISEIKGLEERGEISVVKSIEIDGLKIDLYLRNGMRSGH
jgi:hypothetical protein